MQFTTESYVQSYSTLQTGLQPSPRQADEQIWQYVHVDYPGANGASPSRDAEQPSAKTEFVRLTRSLRSLDPDLFLFCF